MLSLDAVVNLLNDTTFQPPPFLFKWRQLYYDMSLHTAGACPSFCSLDERNQFIADQKIYPTGWLGRKYDWMFDTFLLNRHPRESESTRQWRLSQYKPYTQAPFRQCIDVIRGAVFQDSNFTVDIKNKEDSDYIWGPNFNGKSLPQYVSENFANICDDANGIFITIPKEPGHNTTTPRVEPAVFFIPTINIITITPDEVIFNILDISWLVNNIGYFRFRYDENAKTHVNVDGVRGYFAHMLNRQPLIVAGGNWNNKGFYESWLKAAQPFADDFISNKSAEQLVNKEASHPYIQMADSDCPECNGAGQISAPVNINAEVLDYHMVRCPKCRGEKTISRNPGEIMTAPAEDMKTDLIKITNPDIGINKFHADYNKEAYDGIMRALHLHYIDAAQSGVAKDKDMETRYQFILNISNDLFDRVLSGLIDNVLSLRNVTKANGAVRPTPGEYIIIKPTQFQIKTAAQLLVEYTEATKAGLPNYLKTRQLEDYVDRQFGGDSVLKKKTSAINQMDVLAGADEVDKQARFLGGAVSSRDWQFNTQLPTMLDAIVRVRGSEWFLIAAYDVIKAEVDKLFAAIPALQATQKSESSTARLT